MTEPIDDVSALPPVPEPGAVIVRRDEWEAILAGCEERKATLARVLSDVKAAKELAAREHETHKREERRLIQDVEREQQSHRRTAASLNTALNALEKLVDQIGRVEISALMAEQAPELCKAYIEARELLLTAGRDVK